MNAKAHWEQIYASIAPNQVSWYRPHLDASLAWIERAARDCSAAVIDVGGGESTLVDDLLTRGFSNLSVLDVSDIAIEATKSRLGEAADRVDWLTSDITEVELPPATYDIWHDRAVFHFLTSAEKRADYVNAVARAVKHDGHVIVSTFGPEGPAKCSGLDVIRYDTDSLCREFGSRFRLVESSTEMHNTPFGKTQQFLYCCLQVG